ncbi:hypothetical protein GN156_22700, partial [bacterium LRH843]|nr:hypothetical protein [bacterium LRH843]
NTDSYIKTIVTPTLEKTRTGKELINSLPEGEILNANQILEKWKELNIVQITSSAKCL